MSSRTVRTPEKALETFLAALGTGATVKEACTAAGLGRSTVYDERARNEVFADRWDAAIEEGTQELETVARRRAVDGSDTLLIFLLKARRPLVYRDRLSVDQRVSGQLKTGSGMLSAEELRWSRLFGVWATHQAGAIETMEAYAALVGDFSRWYEAHADIDEREAHRLLEEQGASR